LRCITRARPWSWNETTPVTCGISRAVRHPPPLALGVREPGDPGHGERSGDRDDADRIEGVICFHVISPPAEVRTFILGASRLGRQG